METAIFRRNQTIAPGGNCNHRRRAAAEIYTSLRAHWHNRILALAPALAYTIEEIDPAGSHADWTQPEQKFYTRLGLRASEKPAET